MTILSMRQDSGRPTRPQGFFGLKAFSLTMCFQALSSGQFRDVMLLRSAEDLENFREMYGIEGTIPEEY